MGKGNFKKQKKLMRMYEREKTNENKLIIYNERYKDKQKQ